METEMNFLWLHVNLFPAVTIMSNRFIFKAEAAPGFILLFLPRESLNYINLKLELSVDYS